MHELLMNKQKWLLFYQRKNSVDDFQVEINEYDQYINALLSLLGSGVTASCVNPGITRTDIARHSIDNSFISRSIIGPFLRAFMKTPMQGAQAVLQCALDPNLNGQCGKYFRYFIYIEISLNLRSFL